MSLQKIKYMEENNYEMPTPEGWRHPLDFGNYLKKFMRLARLEHEHKGIEYEPTYENIIKHCDKDNIAHLAQKLRVKGSLSLEEKKDFVDKSKPFIEHYKEFFKKLD